MVLSEFLQIAHDVTVPVAAGVLMAFASLSIVHRARKLFQSFNDPK
jgi:hypothetical protein